MATNSQAKPLDLYDADDGDSEMRDVSRVENEVEVVDEDEARDLEEGDDLDANIDDLGSEVGEFQYDKETAQQLQNDLLFAI